ncbi:MAG: S8 family peptidase [Pseudomonadota bacterium]
MSALALALATVAAGTAVHADDGDYATPLYGHIEPFYGNTDPFYGNIDPFYGNIDPFYGNINPFYGHIEPFYGNIDPFYGDLDPFYGNIDPFWGHIDPFGASSDDFYKTIGPFWSKAGEMWRATTADWDAGAVNGVTGLVDAGRDMFGDRFAANELDYDDAVTDVLKRHGFELDDAASFADASVTRREAFMLDFYDTLMAESGRNHVDHWMGTVRWAPSITQAQSSGGTTSTIGIIDGALTNDPDVSENLGYAGGLDGTVHGHGANVASLIVSAHDGRGVMGIAPHSKVVAYNPFDETNTASWDDIRRGITELHARDTSVINLSLGKSGWVLHQRWNGVLGYSRKHIADDVVYVKAAGNDGIAQEKNIWFADHDPTLLIVGSVDLAGKISDFSNRPGTACIIQYNSKCQDGDRLMDKFLVAPGEMILMADGHGGTVRRSGTSFAAPLVSGAVALMHDRWPWLRRHPEETADIILTTATDLGAEGVDEVYGHGLLNVEASQSPINYDALTAIRISRRGIELKPLKQSRIDDTLPTWTASDPHIHAFEHTGDTYRDFLIPLSSRLHGKKKRLGRWGEMYADFLADDFWDYWEDDDSNSGNADRDEDEDRDDDGDDFTDVRSLSFASAGLDVSVRGTSMLRFQEGAQLGEAHHEVALSSGRSTIRAGHGLGVMALTEQDGFGLTRDHVEGRSGVNPVLGFASGGPFIGALHEIDPFIAFSGGISSARIEHDDINGIDADQARSYRNLTPYAAMGVTFGVHITPAKGVEVNLSYTRLDEATAILGVQSQEEDDFAGGSETDAVTLGVDANLPSGFLLAASATVSRTDSGAQDRLLSVAPGGIVSTAFAASMTKNSVFGERDLLRLTVTQPLHVETGDLRMSQGGIVDRTTGEIGNIVSDFSIANQARPMNAELRYAAPVMDGGSVSLYGRADRNLYGIDGDDAVSLGMRFRVGF